MNIVGCLDSPTDGSYLLDDRDVARLDDDALAAVRNRTIGFVFQSHNLLARKTALENVMLPMLYAAIPRAERRRRAEERLRELGLGERMAHRPSELSGGQSQRVAIARALVTSPKLILADEPTGNVDSKTSQEILDLLIDINRRSGVTLVIVTHDPRVAERAQRQIVIVDGRLTEKAAA
jgi:putative ABC transport system ATP-binding protein